MAAPSPKTLSSFRGVLEELDSCAALAADPDRCDQRADEISHWGVRQHLDHLLITDQKILEGLHAGLSGEAANDPQGTPSWMGRFILVSGFIPRGRGRAPEFVLPTDRKPEQIAEELSQTRSDYQQLEAQLGELEAFRGTQAHPLLGHFTSVDWLRFAHLHHRHHAKIVRDILRRPN